MERMIVIFVLLAVAVFLIYSLFKSEKEFIRELFKACPHVDEHFEYLGRMNGARAQINNYPECYHIFRCTVCGEERYVSSSHIPNEAYEAAIKAAEEAKNL